MKAHIGVLSVIGALIGNASLANTVGPVEAVAALEEKFGVVKGKRRNHTKGLCFGARFKASDVASRYTKSEIFNGKDVHVTGRFSHAGGNINMPDQDGTVFGMALEFKAGKSLHKMAMLNIPFFPVPTPEDFVNNLRLSTPHKTEEESDRIAKRKEFINSHPTIGQLGTILGARGKNYTDYTDHFYNSIHTFHLTNQMGEKTPARWYFYPSGANKIAQDASPKNPASHFEDSIQNRLENSNITFDMIVSFPLASDNLDDPSVQWVTSGQTVNFGRLTLTDLNKDCENINFDPNVLSAGFTSSSDPVLLFRSGAYAVSFGKRLSEQSK